MRLPKTCERPALPQAYAPETNLPLLVEAAASSGFFNAKLDPDGVIGTVPGAILGALVMQALAYGLAYLGHSTPVQNIVSGIVLITAVGFDTWNRRRAR